MKPEIRLKFPIPCNAVPVPLSGRLSVNAPVANGLSSYLQSKTACGAKEGAETAADIRGIAAAIDVALGILYCPKHRPKLEEAKHALDYGKIRSEMPISPLQEFAELINLHIKHSALWDFPEKRKDSYLAELGPLIDNLRQVSLAVPANQRDDISRIGILANQAAINGELDVNFRPDPAAKEWVEAYSEKLATTVLLNSDVTPKGMESAILLAMTWIDQTKYQITSAVVGQLDSEHFGIALGVATELGEALAVSFFKKLKLAGKFEFALAVENSKTSELEEKYEHSRFNACRNALSKLEIEKFRSPLGSCLVRYDLNSSKKFLDIFESAAESWKKYLSSFRAVEANLEIIDQLAAGINQQAVRDILPNALPDRLSPQFKLGNIIIEYPGASEDTRICVTFNEVTQISSICLITEAQAVSSDPLICTNGLIFSLNSSAIVTKHRDNFYCGLHFERFCAPVSEINKNIPAFEDLFSRAKHDLAIVNAIVKFEENELKEPIIISFRPGGVCLIYPSRLERFEHLKDVDSEIARDTAEHLSQFIDFNRQRIYGVRLRRLSREVEREQKKIGNILPEKQIIKLQELFAFAAKQKIFPILDKNAVSLSGILGADINLNLLTSKARVVESSPGKFERELLRSDIAKSPVAESKLVLLTAECDSQLKEICTVDQNEYKEILNRLSRLSQGDLGEYGPAYNDQMRGMLELKIRLGGGVRIYLKPISNGYVVSFVARNKDSQGSDIEKAAGIIDRHWSNAQKASNLVKQIQFDIIKKTAD